MEHRGYISVFRGRAFFFSFQIWTAGRKSLNISVQIPSLCGNLRPSNNFLYPFYVRFYSVSALFYFIFDFLFCSLILRNSALLCCRRFAKLDYKQRRIAHWDFDWMRNACFELKKNLWIVTKRKIWKSQCLLLRSMLILHLPPPPVPLLPFPDVQKPCFTVLHSMLTHL